MEFIKLAVDGAIATLTISRPDRLNALDNDVLSQLSETLTQLSTNREVRCLIVTGEGRAFVAGADISQMRDMDPGAAASYAQKGQRIFAQLENLPFPSIAAVNGFALGGGCELALSCDFIYASDAAKFGQPEVKLGVIPGFGGTQRLLRRVGVGHARELIYTGAVINAAEAQRIGLCNAVVPAAELIAKVTEVARSIAAVGPRAVNVAKRTILFGESATLTDGNNAEARAFGQCFTTADQKEGMSAFLEKRQATFTGN
ncbi:MAG: enoyl-CoA hydratase/isomerase family protein [Sandaracinaceae bacterium]|nr:enoyl-CoA hydratase/isomerase family protein [Sandaracinaceae bacterium]